MGRYNKNNDYIVEVHEYWGIPHTFFFLFFLGFFGYWAVEYFQSGRYKENIAIDFYYYCVHNSPSPYNDANGYNKRIWGCTYDEYIRKIKEKTGGIDHTTLDHHKCFDIGDAKGNFFDNDHIYSTVYSAFFNRHPAISLSTEIEENIASKLIKYNSNNDEGASFFLFNPNELNEVIMWPLNLPLPCSEMMNGMVKLYLNSMSINLSIFLAVLWLMIEALKTSSISMPKSKSWGKVFYTDVKKKAYLFYSYPTHYEVWEEHLIDIYAIVVPTLIVLNQIVPTLGFLYNEEFLFYENVIGFEVNLIGNQWFWTYEYIIDLKVDKESFSWHPYFKFYYMFEDDFKKEINIFFSYNSVLIETDNRLLDVDKTLVLPIHTNVLFNFTSRDVIHSWALPQMGIKMDCVPGRVTNTLFNSYSIGVYYGQCSELCGPLHGFMPICVEVLLPDYFVIWALLEAKLYSPDFNFSYYDIIKKLDFKDYIKYNLVKLT